MRGEETDSASVVFLHFARTPESPVFLAAASACLSVWDHGTSCRKDPYVVPWSLRSLSQGRTWKQKQKFQGGCFRPTEGRISRSPKGLEWAALRTGQAEARWALGRGTGLGRRFGQYSYLRALQAPGEESGASVGRQIPWILASGLQSPVSH